MRSQSIRLGRLAGIPIGLHPLWFLTVGVITWSLGAFYYPAAVSGISPGLSYALGLLSALLLFASIVLHELGHSLVARRHGVEIEEIDLWLLGGVARMKGSPHEAEDELRFALAGPAVTLAIAITFALIALALPASTPQALRALIEYQLFVNGAILVFNLLPAFPLDGGRVARALIWRHTGDVARATAVAARIGRGFGYAMLALGLLGVAAGAIGGIWLAIVGMFVIAAAGAEESATRTRAIFTGREARQFMSFPAVTVPSGITAQEALSHFARHRFSALPVVDDGNLVGLLRIDSIEAIPAPRRSTVLVDEIADPDPNLLVDADRDIGEVLESEAFQRIGRVIVRVKGRGIGVLSITDLKRAERILALGAAVPPKQGRRPAARTAGSDRTFSAAGTGTASDRAGAGVEPRDNV